MKIITTPAAGTALDLTKTKLFCRVTDNAEDALITQLMGAAETACERYTNRSLRAQTVQLFLNSLPTGGVVDLFEQVLAVYSDGPDVELPKGYVSAVAHVKVHGEDGSETTLEGNGVDYILSIGGQERNIVKFLTPLPVVLRAVDAIEIQYTAGVATVPEDITLGMMQCVAYWYENRDMAGTLLRTTRGLWNSYRVIPVGRR